jgi:hypothetical protein
MIAMIILDVLILLLIAMITILVPKIAAVKKQEIVDILT